MNETAAIPELDFDPYASENLLDPYPMHEAVREAGPVVRLRPYPTLVACGRHEQVHAVLRNPYEHEGNHHAGNKMSLVNIRERLALHFDAEASLTTTVSDSAYQVHIVIPYQKAPET